MADIDIGNVSARLRLDFSQLQQDLQRAQQEFGQFQQHVQRSVTLPALSLNTSAFQHNLQQAQQALTQFQQTMERRAMVPPLRLDTSQLQQGLQQAQQALAQFQQGVQRSLTLPAFTLNTSALQQSVTQAQTVLTQFQSTVQRTSVATRLTLDVSQLTQGLAQAQTALTQFQQSLQRSIAVPAVQLDTHQLTQGIQQAQQAFTQFQQTLQRSGVAARLSLDTTQLTQSLQQAQVALAEFQQTLQRRAVVVPVHVDVSPLQQSLAQAQAMLAQFQQGVQRSGIVPPPRLDTSQLTQSLQQAQQALTQFQQTVTQFQQSAQRSSTVPAFTFNTSALEQSLAQAQQVLTQFQQQVQRSALVPPVRLDTSQLQQGLLQAQQALAQFQRQMHSVTPPQIGQATRQSAQEAATAARQAAQEASQAFRREAQERAIAGRQAAQEARAQYQQQAQAARDAAQQSSQAFRTSFQQTATEARQAAQASAQAFQREMAQLRQSQAASGSLLQGILGGGLQVAAGLGIATTIAGIVSALKDFVTASITAAASMERLRAQFTALQGAGQGAVTLQGLFQTAQRLGVEFTSLATAFRSFDAATQGTAIAGERARRVFEQIVTGARAMGASSEQTSRALLALQQMVSKGVVSQEELRQQLGESLPGALGIAARAYGVTTAEMNKMIEKGMDAVSFVQTFGDQVEREFSGKAATATNTLTTAWQRFLNELEQFQGALAGGDLLNTLRDLANWATKVIENLRAAQELRRERTGGDLPVIPQEMAEIPGLQARQKELQTLQDLLKASERGFLAGEVGFFSGAPSAEAIEQARQRLRDLMKEQQAAIKTIQDQWAAETVPPPTRAMLPGTRAFDAIQKMLEEGRKSLAAIDLSPLLTDAEKADERLKAWEQTMKRVNEELAKAGQGVRALMLAPTEKQTPFDTLITRIAGEQRVDPLLARALVEQESRFDPRARSRTGAMGLTQLMPGTARQMGVPAGQEFDPEANLRAGLGYLSNLLKQFNNDWQKALTAYNAGPGRGGIPLPTGENATFAQEVLQRRARMAGTLPGQLDEVLQQRRALEAGVSVQKLAEDQIRLLHQQIDGQEQLTIKRRADIKAQEDGRAAAERFAQEEQAALAQRTLEARRRVGLLPIDQQLTHYRQQLTQVKAEADRVGAEVERQQAQQQLPGLQARLTSIQTLLGRPEVSAPEQARQAVVAQGAEARRGLFEILQSIQQNPVLAQIAPQILDQWEAAFAQLPTFIEQQGQKAFEALDEQMRRHVQQIGESVTQIQIRMEGRELSPVLAGMQQNQEQFRQYGVQLQQLRDQLEQDRKRATEARQQEIDEELRAIDQTIGAIPQKLEAVQVRFVARPERATLADLDQQLERARAVQDARMGFTAGQLASRNRELMSEEGKEELDRRVALLNAQERLNQYMGLFEDLASSVGSAWTSALMSIADGTKTVADAFKEMARSILQSMAQIASQEAFKALIRIGFGILGAAFGATPAVGGATSFGAAPTGTGFLSSGGGFAFGTPASASAIGASPFQHGGVVNRPTLGLLGENPAHNPEYVLNRQQMQSVIGQTAGTSRQDTQGISIINVASKEEGDRQAAQEQAKGRQVVLNYIMDDLRQGSGSQVGRLMRISQQ